MKNFLRPASAHFFRHAALLLCALAIVGVARADVSPGEILIGEMNCVACHNAPDAVKVRLASRMAPGLGQRGTRVTPQWLRAFLANPQALKPGTKQPDLLHALPAAEKSAAVEALTHYLISLQKTDDSKPLAASTALISVGKDLYHTVGCVVCHAPTELPAQAPHDARTIAELQLLQHDSEPLGDLARKFAVNDLAAFLRDPLRTHPSGRMPAQNLSDGEARALAMFLLQKQVSTGPTAKVRGVSYEYFDAPLANPADFDKATPKATGTTEKFTLSVALRPNSYALRFRGIIAVPKDGEYTFGTHSDDGSHLYIDEKLVVDNGGIHPGQDREGKVQLKAGDHTITLTYFDGGGGTELTTWWQGPGLAKQEIPATVLAHEGRPMRPLDDAPFSVDATLAAQGKEWFAKLNCAACHQLDQPGKPAKPLAQLAGTSASGCLGKSPAADVPQFTFTDAQRTALVAQLGNQAALAQPLSNAELIKRTMTVMNCYGCHSRDKLGGPTGLRRAYFTTAALVNSTPNLEQDLGDEGRIPPHLTGVGAKLKLEWLKQVLWNGGPVRPYMATRMPQFGGFNLKQLPDAFEQVDNAGRTAPEIVVNEADVKAGHKLVGVTGLSCVQCHTFAGHPSLGVPALDLTTETVRLRSDWFRRYLLDPQSLRPGTRMPQFWPEGKAARKDVLGGDTEKQITAIWSYLSHGKSAAVPLGLTRATMEIAATTEAVIYRHFIQGCSPRGIGVAYPERLDLAFDADQVRLALLWQGPFIDAARHRSGRGEGFTPPLGFNVVHAAPGAPFAVLESPTTVWPDKLGKEAGYQFRGYSLDEKQRPAFYYSFAGARVEDYPLPFEHDNELGFRRAFAVTATKPIANLYFRAAVAANIKDQGHGVYLVDDLMRLKFADATPTLRRSGDKQELLVPVTFRGTTAKFVEEIVW